MQNYTVRSGDTLSQIASRNGMSLSQLLALNPQFKSNPNLIKPGQTVNLKGGSPATSPQGQSAVPQDKNAYLLGIIQQQAPQLVPMLNALSANLAQKQKQGQVVNPDINITPAHVQDFLGQAQKELDPQYQEQINFLRKDLSNSLSQLQNDYQSAITESQDNYKDNTGILAENAAQSGIAFSSAREDQKKKLAVSQQRQLDMLSQQATRSAQNAGSNVERQIGSKEFNRLGTPKINKYSVTPEGFNQAGRESLLSPQGGLLGSLGKQRQVDLSSRKAQLERNFRLTRNLNLSPLGTNYNYGTK